MTLLIVLPNSRKHAALLLPIEFKEVTPKLKDEDGNDIDGSDKPKSIPEVNEMIKEPYAGNVPNIAYRSLHVKVPDMLKWKKVKWTMTPQFTPPGESQPRFRGQWPGGPNADRFVATDGAANYYSFERTSQEEGKTKIDDDGDTEVRINVPPIAYNKARVKMEFEDYPGAYVEIDFEVPGVVVIDPGHGGTENMAGSSANNAVSTSGVLEKNMALSYGLQLRDTLKQKAQAQKKNIKVLMTRTTDKNLGGTERANKARDKGADDFFVIRFNSDDGHTARGTLAVVRASNDNVNLNEDNSFINPVVQGVVNAMKSYDALANVRTPVPKDTNASNDINLGNTANFHPVRFGYIEVEFIDTPAVDALLNTGPNAGAVQGAIINAMADGILSDLNTQPAQP